jgi:hypothetical protein
MDADAATDYNQKSKGSAMPKKTKGVNEAAATLGRLGGSANTKAQNRARKINGQKGGRPRRVCSTCGEPVIGGGVHKDRALDVTCKGRLWVWQKPSDRP